VADEAGRTGVNADDLFIVGPQIHYRFKVRAADCVIERGFGFVGGLHQFVLLGHGCKNLLSMRNNRKRDLLLLACSAIHSIEQCDVHIVSVCGQQVSEQASE
jgi:hypothetical protein